MKLDSIHARESRSIAPSWRRAAVLAGVVALVMAGPSCEKKSPLEKAADDAEEAAEKAADAVGDAAEKVADEVKDAAEEVKDAANQ